MSGNGFVWAGVGLIGVAMLAPSLPGGAPPAPAAREAEPEAQSPPAPIGNGFASHNMERSGDGHFYAEAQVNGARIRFLVDTGATLVVLTRNDAQRAGIALGGARGTAIGAGGEVETIPVTIERIALGPLAARDVPGAVVETLPVSLLGQSFLRQIGTAEIRGDTMVLR